MEMLGPSVVGRGGGAGTMAWEYVSGAVEKRWALKDLVWCLTR